MLIILDRDGVINHDSEFYIKSPEEWHPISGSLEAIALLTKAGHTLVIATNQAGVGRGYYSLEMLEKIHQKMLQLIEQKGGKIDHIYFCPHHPDDQCDCRKPKPGLLLQIQRDYSELFSGAIFVGDSLRDIQAAHAANCRAALVRTGYGEKTLVDHAEELKGVSVYENLLDFAQSLRIL